MQVPHSIPTTLLNFRVSLRHYPSLGSMALSPAIRKLVSSTIPSMLPAFVWGRSNHARMSSWGSPANVSCCKSNKGYEWTMQHIHSHAQNLGNECADRAAALVKHTTLSQTRTHTLVGFTLHSTPLLCLRHVTTWMTTCRCNANLERHIHLLHNVWSEARGLFRVVSPGGLLSPSPLLNFNLVVVLCCVAQPRQTPLFSAESLGWQWMDPLPRLHARPCSPFRIPMNMTNTTCGILCWDFSVMSMWAHSWRHISMKQTWGDVRCLVILPWMYQVTKRTFIFLMNAPLGTIALGASLRRLSIVTVTTHALLVT